jgi:hypothetical protein
MKVYELLSEDSRWCQNTMAKNARGKDAGADYKSAVSWCLSGALKKCYPPMEEYFKKISKVEDFLGEEVCAWNDTPERKFEEVVALVRHLDI